MLPCFFGGFSSRLFWSMFKALINRGRVSLGRTPHGRTRVRVELPQIDEPAGAEPPGAARLAEKVR